MSDLNNNINLLNRRICELETKLSFQENTIEDLNNVIINQQFSLDKMQQQLRLLAQKIRNLEPNNNIASQSEETPPPHY